MAPAADMDEFESTFGEQVKGTCLVVGAALTFAVVALVVKVDTLPLLPATECRFLVAWIVSLLFMVRYKQSRGLRWFGPKDSRRPVVLKAVLSYVFITAWWAALRRAPLGDCIAIIYCAPVLTSIWSAIFLREALLPVFPLQVLLVGLGALLVLDPPFLSRLLASDDALANTAVAQASSSHGSSWGYGCMAFALTVASFVPIASRQARFASWIEVEHVNASLSAGILNPVFALMHTAAKGQSLEPDIDISSRFLSMSEVIMISLAAVGSFVGIAMETRGYQLAEPGKASMFRYVEIPFAYFLQALGTSEAVSTRAVLGSMLIVTAVAAGAVAQRAADWTQLKKPLLDVSPGGESGGGSDGKDPRPAWCRQWTLLLMRREHNHP